MGESGTSSGARTRAARLQRASSLWIQAGLLLELGHHEQAAALGVEAFASARPTRRSHRGQVEVFGCADVGDAWCLLHPELEVAVFSLAVWKRHCCSPLLYRLGDLGRELTGPVWARFDVEEFDLDADLRLMEHGHEPFFFGRPLH